MINFNNDVQTKVLDEYTQRKVMGSTSSLMLVEITFKKDGVGATHSHEAHEQVSYIVKGSFEVTLGDEVKVLKAGDSFSAGFNVPHGVKALEDSIIIDSFTPLRQDFL
ncbi:MAG TPA: cupin domain-containing protein [Clostridiaceae bacterium]